MSISRKRLRCLTIRSSAVWLLLCARYLSEAEHYADNYYPEYFSHCLTYFNQVA